MHGKLSLEAGTPTNVVCHNDMNKKACDNCMGCFDPSCTGINCGRTVFINGEKFIGNCTCQRTQCICLGRMT